MIMDERVEAAARARYYASADRIRCSGMEWEDLSPDHRAQRCADEAVYMAAAFPELHGNQPKGWIAPWEVTDKMRSAVAEATPLPGYVWKLARDAYLGKGDGG